MAGPGLPSPANVRLAKPIYDWQEDDVFKYFHENDIKYCSFYDQQMWAGESLRVSTPLHAESAKRFDRLRAIDPVFYEQVTALFPEMLVQSRYYGELDKAALRARYGQTYEGVRQWIDENLADDEHEYELALRRYNSVMQRAHTMPTSYPAPYLLTAFMNGAYKREILPLGPT